MAKTTLTYILKLILEILLILLLVILVILIAKYVLLYKDVIKVHIALTTNFEQELTHLYARASAQGSMSTDLLTYISIAVILSIGYKF